MTNGSTRENYYKLVQIFPKDMSLMIDPTCTQVLENVSSNLHSAIVYRGKSLTNKITSCDPTGAGISDNQG